MTTKGERHAARDRVAAYHESCLQALVDHVAEAIDRYRAGAIEVHETDVLLHQYQRAARELWKFCWAAGGGVQLDLIAGLIADQTVPIDWWQRGAPRQRP